MSNHKTPKGEKSWMLCTNEAGTQYIITSKENDRSMYYLYEIQDDGKLKKVGKNSDSREFDSIIFKTAKS